MSLKLCYSQMDRGWMYIETVTALFIEGIDSFVKATKAYAGNNVGVVKDAYTAHVLIARVKRHSGSATSSRYDIIC